MPKLVCRTCGQGVYTTAPFEQLFADERGCPRCGHLLFSDRRSGLQRRRMQRRGAPVEDAAVPALEAGPMTASPLDGDATIAGRIAVGPGRSETAAADMPDVGAIVAATMTDRRVADRRQIRRRSEDNSPFQRVAEEAGWAG